MAVCPRLTSVSARLIHLNRRAVSLGFLGGSVSARSSHFCFAWARAFQICVCSSSSGTLAEDTILGPPVSMSPRRAAPDAFAFRGAPRLALEIVLAHRRAKPTGLRRCLDSAGD